MKVRWTGKASSDLVILTEFLSPKSRRAAARVVQMLHAAPSRLRDQPRIGEQIENAGPREIRRLLIGDYEMHYEVRSDEIWIARIFHTLEDR